MSEKKYSKKHEWIALNGETATVGISKHATEMLGDIVFVELPEKGKGLNKDPENNGWFFKIKIKDKSELDSLMSQTDYEKFVKDNPN